MNRKRLWGIGTALLSMVYVTGCSLIPKEADGNHNIVLATKEAKSFEYVEVIRGDVTNVKKVFFTYQQTEDVTHSFGVKDREVKYVYVENGDEVKAGDILAKCDTSDIEDRLKELAYQKEKNTLLLNQVNELKTHRLTELKNRYNNGSITKEAYDEGVTNINDEYAVKITSYTDELEIINLRIDEANNEFNNCIITAKIDGVVSYVFNGLLGSYSRYDTNVITLVDKTQCAFATNKKDDIAELFTDGDAIALILDDGTTVDTVVSTTASENKIFLMPEDVTIKYSVGTQGTYEMVIDKAENVICIPGSTVHMANDQSYVYIEGENGIKSLTYITIGLKGNGYWEVTSGLNEGDIIIK